MDTSLITLKILSVYLIISGFFLIFRRKDVPHLLKDFFDHPAIMYLTGIILIFLSSMYLIQYNIWDGTWKTLLTIFAWLVGLKGVAYIFAPKLLSELAIRKSKRFFATYGVIAIVVGVYLFSLN